jgi:serine/threonine protein kinase
MPLSGEAPHRDTYVNLQRIQGSTQLVHRCRHAVLGADCVQKTVPISQGSVAFFEPRLLEDLDHPHITPVREAQFDPNLEHHVTFVMPWYEGGSVAAALAEDHRFSVGEAVALLRDVLDALEYVHTRKQYVHRDIKAGNILLEADRSSALLSDFGLAAALNADGVADAVLATYEYMAPECALTGQHDPRSDLYGVGVLMFELLNGRLKWEELDRQAVEKRVLQGRRALPDAHFAPSAFAPHVPPELVRITRKTISRDPLARHQSAAELLRALNQPRFIDWRQVDSDGLDGTWEGGWPPQARVGRQDRYRVTSRVMRRGPSAGMRRVVVEYQRVGTSRWRRIGVPDRDISIDDAGALRTAFAETAVNAAHRRAAR